MRRELDQIHERLDQLENVRVEKPQHIPHACWIGRIQPRESQRENGDG